MLRLGLLLTRSLFCCGRESIPIVEGPNHNSGAVSYDLDRVGNRLSELSLYCVGFLTPSPTFRCQTDKHLSKSATASGLGIPYGRKTA